MEKQGGTCADVELKLSSAEVCWFRKEAQRALGASRKVPPGSKRNRKTEDTRTREQCIMDLPWGPDISFLLGCGFKNNVSCTIDRLLPFVAFWTELCLFPALARTILSWHWCVAVLRYKNKYFSTRARRQFIALDDFSWLLCDLATLRWQFKGIHYSNCF